jgi:chorismate synthase
MGDNTLGRLFRITSFGESHGNLVGIVIDGVPVGLDFDLDRIQKELDKRKPGLSDLLSERLEPDIAKILSGVFNNKTTGAPICLVIENQDSDSSFYEKYKNFLRPSHVDYSALKKYSGFADYRGSGRFSGRITATFVMAGAIAKQILLKHNITVFSYTKSIGNIEDNNAYIIDNVAKYLEKREKSIVRTVNPEIAKSMENLIKNVKSQNDSIGGTIKCVVNNLPSGVGGPIFNSLESHISKAMFSVPAIKGIEFGAGFQAAKMRGSEHNDPWRIENDKIISTKNDSGGIIGGISTGMPIEFTVAVKPTASIGIPQETVNIKTMENVTVEIKGRHDPCIVPRAVIVVEAMAAIVILDFLLIEGKISQTL